MAKVLIVDDDYHFSEFMKMQMESAGHEVVICLEGELALDTARAERPDAILLDLILPDLDGIEVLKLLKKDPVVGDVPVFLCSVDKGNERIPEALRMGANLFFPKPLDRGTLQKALESLPERS